MSTNTPIPTSLYTRAGDAPRAHELRAVLFTSSPALLAAVWSVPGFADREAALWRFSRLREHVLNVAREVAGDSVAADIVKIIDTTLDDELDPADFLTRVESLRRRQELDVMIREVLTTVVFQLWNQRTAVLQTAEGERAVIRHLNLQLAAVLGPLGKLGVRDSDRDSTLAIDGRVQQYTALKEALGVFDDIVGAIRTWHSAHGVGNGVPHYWLAALIPHPRTVDPLVGVALSDCYAWNPTSGETYEGTPWPEVDDETNRGRLLVWLAQHPELVGFLPTVDQWRARDAELRAAKSEALSAASGSLSMRVVRDGRLTKRLIEGTPEAGRRTVTVSRHDEETAEHWHVRRRDDAVSE